MIYLGISKILDKVGEKKNGNPIFLYIHPTWLILER
jgi:hypothetical protein